MTTPYARKVPDLPPARIDASVAAVNEVIQALVDGGKIVHHQYKSASLIATPDATDLATSKTLAKALALALVAHGADADIHAAADVITQAASWTSAPAEPANLTEVQNIANTLKSDINTHVANATPHRSVWGGPGVNGVITAHALTTTTATDQTTANALLNAVKNFLNLHMKAAASSIQLISS